MAEENEKNTPKAHIRSGTVQATLWDNESREGKKYNSYTLKRSYKTPNDKWESTASLREADLAHAKHVLDKLTHYFEDQKNTK